MPAHMRPGDRSMASQHRSRQPAELEPSTTGCGCRPSCWSGRALDLAAFEPLYRRYADRSLSLLHPAAGRSRPGSRRNQRYFHQSHAIDRELPTRVVSAPGSFPSPITPPSMRSAPRAMHDRSMTRIRGFQSRSRSPRMRHRWSRSPARDRRRCCTSDRPTSARWSSCGLPGSTDMRSLRRWGAAGRRSIPRSPAR